MKINKNIFIILSLLLITGCRGNCPKGYLYADDRCYKYDNVDARVEYYCNNGGTLDGTKCIVMEEYNCSMLSDKEICNSTYDYPANKEYTCPTGYELNGIKCSKLIYYKK